MGRPKAFIEVDGRSLLDLAVAALTDAAVDPIVVVGGDQGAI
ncbi:MAG TPA: molybdopterin-guanine dinucleotide biosynthesis protein MobA, partial [Acidimicrobiaceae bacterium]|nr:molybdopterin-guanine dinucleotide biosynthesis protein MobA [Acidimicrobiaceae bacterium]